MATSSNAQLDFVARMWDAVTRVWPGSSSATRALIVAHAAYESGYGSGTAYRVGNNPFNIVKGSANVPSVESGDLECDASGKCVPIKQKFRVYASLEDAVRDYLALLQTVRYMSAYTLLRVGDVGFAAALGNTGYYTLPVDQYVRNFKGVLVGVQKRLVTLSLAV